MSNEIWRSIPGYETSYEVSDRGRIRSLTRTTDRGRKWRGRMMTPSTMPSGYLIVTLWRDGSQNTRLVHRLVLTAFVGAAPDKTEALHRDGDPSNNNLLNLAWGTHSENMRDQVDHGKHVHASKNACPSGHPYTEENTYIYPGRPHRGCRQCRRDYARAWREANPERAREMSRRASRKYQSKKKAA